MTSQGESVLVTASAGVRERVAKAQRGLDPQTRRRVMDDVALRADGGWMVRFAVMLGLSVVVAVMGLSAGSGPVVIGAMLLAPLVTPVMGAAAALAMALPRHLVRSLAVVVAASVLSVLLAFLIEAVLRDATLSSEVLSRTSPDLRDLIVALAAGAACAYATLRPDQSNALPGVAVAVALVPPLATIGITMQAGRGDLAGGAVLLYVANLLAMILMATLVFLATGFVPRGRLAARRSHVIGGGLAVAAATVAVAVPLALASVDAAEAGANRARLQDAADGWIGSTADELDEVRIDGDVVRISVSGPNPPPATDELERTIEGTLGPSAALQVRWTQTQDGEAVAAPTTDVNAEGSAEAVRAIVHGWLDRAGAAGYEITRLDVGDSEVRIDLVSAEPPPSVDELTASLLDAAGLTVPVVVDWTQGTIIRSDGGGDDVENPTVATSTALRAAVDDWAGDVDDIDVDTVTFDGEHVAVGLLGPETVDVTGLEEVVHDVAGEDLTVEIWLTHRERLTAADD